LPFGPRALLGRVRNIDEAIEKTNSVPYGLAGYAFTNSARNVDRLAEGLEVGNLSINHFVASVAETPFGSGKDSGFGREGGTEGLHPAIRTSTGSVRRTPKGCAIRMRWDNRGTGSWGCTSSIAHEASAASSNGCCNRQTTQGHGFLLAKNRRRPRPIPQRLRRLSAGPNWAELALENSSVSRLPMAPQHELVVLAN
jgi:hypothetical protein